MGAAVNGNNRYCSVVIFTFGVYEMQRTIPKICLFHLLFCIVGRVAPARVLLNNGEILYNDIQFAACTELFDRVRIHDDFKVFSIDSLGLSAL